MLIAPRAVHRAEASCTRARHLVAFALVTLPLGSALAGSNPLSDIVEAHSCIGRDSPSPFGQPTLYLLGTAHGLYVAGACIRVETRPVGLTGERYEVNAHLVVPGSDHDFRFEVRVGGAGDVTCPGHPICDDPVRVNLRLCTPFVPACDAVREGPVPATSWSMRLWSDDLCRYHSGTNSIVARLSSTDRESGITWRAEDAATFTC